MSRFLLSNADRNFHGRRHDAVCDTIIMSFSSTMSIVTLINEIDIGMTLLKPWEKSREIAEIQRRHPQKDLLIGVTSGPHDYNRGKLLFRDLS